MSTTLPSLPWWLRPFARFDAGDHFAGRLGDSLRDRVDTFLADHEAALPGGRITALVQARVLGYVFNPISIFWCHDREGVLRHVIVEVHNTYGGASRLPVAAGEHAGAGRPRSSTFRRSTRWLGTTRCWRRAPTSEWR